jgi:hypothetical protein
MCDRLHVLATILTRWRHPVASIKALDHQAMRAVLCWCTAVAINMASKICPFFHRCFVCCCPHWGNTEQVVTQWKASSGFRDSPGRASLGDVVCIAPTCLHGHQNGQQRRCICFLLPPFLLTVIAAKDHVMVN